MCISFELVSDFSRHHFEQNWKHELSVMDSGENAELFMRGIKGGAFFFPAGLRFWVPKCTNESRSKIVDFYAMKTSKVCRR